MSAQVTLASEFSDHLWLQGDIGLGYQQLSINAANELMKRGPLFGGRILGEYRHSTFGAFGIGLGLLNTSQEGETDFRIQEYTLRTMTLDASYLYPFFSEFFWVGWLVRNQIGEGARFDFRDISGIQLLVTTGPQIRFNFKAKSWDWIAGANALYAVNGGPRSIISLQVFGGISIPLSKGTPKKNEESVSAPRVSEKVPPQVKVEFDTRLVNFNLNKSTLRLKSKTFLTNVAQVLVSQLDNWKTIEISGHTDVTGNPKKNLQLSERRAKSVMNWIVSKGVPANKVMSRGYGSEHLLPGVPANSEENRRVELMLSGVVEQKKLNEAMAELMKRE